MIRSLMLFFLLSSILIAQEGEAWFVDRVAVKVNDKIITEQELLIMYNQKKSEILQNFTTGSIDLELEKAWEEVMNDAIDQLLLYEKSVELGMDISEETLDGNLQNQKESNGLTQEEFEKMIKDQTGMTLRQYMESMVRFQSGQRVIQAKVWGAIVINDPELAKYYEEHIQDFTNPETFEIAEIVCAKGQDADAARAKAEECYQKLVAGMDFPDAVEAYSEAASKAIKGDLGELQRGDLNKTIEDAALVLEPGQFSPIIEMQDFFYIVKLMKRVPATPKPIDEVKDEIQNELRQPRFDAALEKYLTDLRENYLIDKLVSKPSTGY